MNKIDKSAAALGIFSKKHDIPEHRAGLFIFLIMSADAEEVKTPELGLIHRPTD